MKLSLETCTSALKSAAINRKASIQLELSTGLAIFLMNGGTGKEARQQLNVAYAEAGYDCIRFGGTDYKTINRRINAAASLYEKLPVAKWVGNLAEMDVIEAICIGLEPYELYSIQDVLRYAAPHKVQHRTPVEPAHDLLSGPATATVHTGQALVMAQFRRASDRPLEGAKRVSTEHLALAIPKDVSRAEIIELAMQLMSLARDEAKELLTA